MARSSIQKGIASGETPEAAVDLLLAVEEVSSILW